MWVCDDYPDCQDGNDESALTCDIPEGECLSCEYKCTNGRCINDVFICDGLDHCGDDSDEDSRANCPSL